MQICPRCLNTDQNYFYKGSKGYYCRKCVPFSRICLEESLEPVSLSKTIEGNEEYTIQFPLTKYQKDLSFKVCQSIHQTDVLLKCVCGAGKTEMCIETISQMLKEGKKVGFAIARRQVVLEVTSRLSTYFSKAKVIGVCGGHTSVLDGDIIVLTTHQLFRYYQAFDVLILDEPDAFPFRGNPTLHGIAKTSCKGHVLYLTATPDETLLKKVEKKELLCYSLPMRPHGKPLPVPLEIAGVKIYLFLYLYIWLRKHPYAIVFVPSISIALVLKRVFSLFFFSVSECTSKTQNKDEIIEKFRRKEIHILFATTILERGVTFPDVDVCVLFADESIFDVAGLVQMAGRAGRNFQNPYGDVLFLCLKKSETVMNCIKEIKESNDALSTMS